MTSYAIRDEHAPRFGRQSLTLWEGAFASSYAGEAVELPGHDGFMVNMRYGPQLRVTCPAPRTEANFLEVDSALNAAIAAAEVSARLEYLRSQLRAERISYAELYELQSLASHIAPGDVELLEAAGVPEHTEDNDSATEDSIAAHDMEAWRWEAQGQA